MKLALLVIDMQKCFLAEYPDQTPIRESCMTINYVAQMLRASGNLVIHVQDVSDRGAVPEEELAFKQPILEKYATESDAYYASARLWDDGIIDPADTYTVLGLALSATLNGPAPARSSYGVFRM